LHILTVTGLGLAAALNSHYRLCELQNRARAVAAIRRFVQANPGSMGRICGKSKIAQITDSEINKYLVYMRTEYIPLPFSGNTRTLSLKSVRNIWITLCAFFIWAHPEFNLISSFLDFWRVILMMTPKLDRSAEIIL
jgi:hypothetical protein